VCEERDLPRENWGIWISLPRTIEVLPYGVSVSDLQIYMHAHMHACVGSFCQQSADTRTCAQICMPKYTCKIRINTNSLYMSIDNMKCSFHIRTETIHLINNAHINLLLSTDIRKETYKRHVDTQKETYINQKETYKR